MSHAFEEERRARWQTEEKVCWIFHPVHQKGGETLKGHWLTRYSKYRRRHFSSCPSCSSPMLWKEKQTYQSFFFVKARSEDTECRSALRKREDKTKQLSLSAHISLKLKGPRRCLLPDNQHSLMKQSGIKPQTSCRTLTRFVSDGYKKVDRGGPHLGRMTDTTWWETLGSLSGRTVMW